MNSFPKRQVGIVLRHSGSYITIFDHKHHRRDVIAYGDVISRGAFISYILSMKKGRCIATDVCLEYMPLMQARLDIYFLHSLLDICYHFIPIASVEVSTYSFVVEVLRSFEVLTSFLIQKQILCALFARLGVYPPGIQAYKFEEQFLKVPIDNVVQENLDLTVEDFLNEWLIWCIEVNPQGKKCKSLSLFLQKR